jgi:hypothetical protein
MCSLMNLLQNILFFIPTDQFWLNKSFHCIINIEWEKKKKILLQMYYCCWSQFIEYHFVPYWPHVIKEFVFLVRFKCKLDHKELKISWQLTPAIESKLIDLSWSWVYNHNWKRKILVIPQWKLNFLFLQIMALKEQTLKHDHQILF